MSVPLGALYASCRQRLRTALSGDPYATPDLDTRLLMGHALDLADHTPISDPARPIADSEAELTNSLIERRACGEPVARILGYRDFWGKRFNLNADTLIPRPETEGIVDVVLAWARHTERTDQPLRIVDVGTGSGAIIVSLLTELPNATGIGSDISKPALEAATQNAQLHGVLDRFKAIHSNYGDALNDQYDVIVSNPPYIRNNDQKNTSRDVLRHDPPRALFGGGDGLDAYRTLLPWCHKMLSEDGTCVFEHGFDQQEQVVTLAKQAGFTALEPILDLNNLPRLVKMVKKAADG